MAMPASASFFALSTGARIPSLGLGTWQADPGVVGDAVIAAVKMGYRHIDCARIYENEKEVGQALKKLFEDGTVRREDLFITSKIWCSDLAPEDVPGALQSSLDDLQLDYLDLYLIHWPCRINKGSSVSGEALVPLDISSTWKAMEAQYDEGKARAIGVGNFSCKKLEDVLAIARVPPAVNQVECHPCWQQSKLHTLCQARNVHLSGYSPLGSPGTAWMSSSSTVLGNPALTAVAEKLLKTPAQVALRWGLQMGHSVLPKTTKEARLKENMDIFDWSIPEEHLAKLAEIEQARRLRGEFFVHEGGVFKSVEELCAPPPHSPAVRSHLPCFSWTLETLASVVLLPPVPLRVARDSWIRTEGPALQRIQKNPAFLQVPRHPWESPRWVLCTSLRSSSFPGGPEPPEADHGFPAVFSHLSSVRAPLLVEDSEESVKATAARVLEEEALRLRWPGGGLPLLWPGGDLKRVFYEDPPWFYLAFTRDLKVLPKTGQDAGRWRYNSLRRRQIKMETEAWELAAEEYQELLREMLEKKLAPNLPYVKSLMLGWFEPLRDAIAREQNLQSSKEKKTRASYAPFIGLLPASKMAVIAMHKMMGLLMTGQEEGCVRVVQAAIHIGEAIEQEVRIHNFLKKSKRARDGDQSDQNDQNEGAIKQREILRKRVRKLMKNRRSVEICKLVRSDDEIKPWGRDAQAKLGSCLIELLMETAFVQPPALQSADLPPDIRPAFRHTFRPVSKEDRRSGKRYGVIECDVLVHEGLDSTAKHMVIPYMPMLINPEKWKGYDKGGHLFLPSYVMRTHGAKPQQDAIRSVPRKQLQKVFEALDTLGTTKWRVNKRVLSVIEAIWSAGGRTAGLVDCKDIPMPEKPDSEDPNEIQKWRWESRRVKKANSEMYAQRCDIELKLSVARKMKDEDGFYYPHNLDFRGRAYPMHPHLNHFGSDLCRGLLEFAEGRPLGKSGLYWLKIHLANLYAGGVEKLAHEERLSFVESHIEDIFDSAEKPLDGRRWWLSAEDPLQCLAACFSLSDVLKSSSPNSAVSHLPIHQDGSCNGLQHYAALGRDCPGAAAVNLVAGEKPADVYSRIAARVLDTIRKDSEKDPATNSNAPLARILLNQYSGGQEISQADGDDISLRCDICWGAGTD